MNAMRTRCRSSRRIVMSLVTAAAIALVAMTPSVARADMTCSHFTVVKSIYIFGIHIGDFLYEEGWTCTPN